MDARFRALALQHQVDGPVTPVNHADAPLATMFVGQEPETAEMQQRADAIAPWVEKLCDLLERAAREQAQPATEAEATARSEGPFDDGLEDMETIAMPEMVPEEQVLQELYTEMEGILTTRIDLSGRQRLQAMFTACASISLRALAPRAVVDGTGTAAYQTRHRTNINTPIPCAASQSGSSPEDSRAIGARSGGTSEEQLECAGPASAKEGWHLAFCN